MYFWGLPVWLFLLLLVYLFGFFFFGLSYILFTYRFFLPRSSLHEVTAAERSVLLASQKVEMSIMPLPKACD